MPTLVVVAVIALVVIAVIRVHSMRDGSAAPPPLASPSSLWSASARWSPGHSRHGAQRGWPSRGGTAQASPSRQRQRPTYLTLASVLGVLPALTVVLHLAVSGFGLTHIAEHLEQRPLEGLVRAVSLGPVRRAVAP